MNASGSPSELLNDPVGKYNQLVRLQEISKESEQAVSYQGRPDISLDSVKHSHQHISVLPSTGHGSSGTGNSGRRSSSDSFGVASAASVREKAVGEAHSKVVEKVLLSRLANLHKPEIPVLLLGLIASVANGLIFPTFGLLLAKSIKTFYESDHKLQKDSEFWALIFVVLGVGSFLTMPLRMYFFGVAGCKLIRRIRLMCFEKVIHMEISWFDRAENSSGAIGARLSTDASAVRGLVGDTLGLLVQNATTAIAGLVIGFEASWQLALIILVMLPLVGLSAYFQIHSTSGVTSNAKVN